MWLNYVRTSVRNIFKFKIYSSITISGLSIGLMICLGIALYLNHELSYDRFHTGSERIYRINSRLHFDDNTFSSPVTSYNLFHFALDHIPSIETGTLAQNHSGGAIVQLQNDRIVEKRGVYFCDEHFFEVFNFDLQKGNKHTALAEPFSVLLTPEKAASYFGDADPIGKTLLVSVLDTTMQFTVTGIIEEAPQNSSIRYAIIFSYATLEALPSSERINSWTSVSRRAYIKLDRDNNTSEVEALLDKAVKEHTGEKKFYVPFLQPVTDIHLNTGGYDLYAAGNINSVYLYAGLALLVLIIAMVNFINLATARAATREREIGMRKVLGDRRLRLFNKFILESVIYVFFAGFFALLLTELFLSFFNDIIGVDLSIMALAQPLYIAALLLLLLLTGIIAGIYPALYMTGFRPVQLLRREKSRGSGGKRFRQLLVIAQFASAVILISGSVYIYEQISMMEERKLGFNKEQLIQVPLFDKQIAEESFRWKDRIKNIPGIADASVSQEIHNDGSTTHAIWFEGESEENRRMVNVKAVDSDLYKTLKLSMKEGEWFSDKKGENQSAFVVNETFVKEYNLTQPVGTFITRNGSEGRIIGVVKDFHFQPFHYKIEPLVLYPMPVGSPYWHFLAEYMFISLNAGHTQQTLNELEKSWDELFPEKPFSYEYASEKIAAIYTGEREMGEIVSLFAVFSIVVALLGLYGLSLFTIEQRRKEIGIRKILGANFSNIMVTISKEFLLLIAAAITTAFPVTYLLTKEWLTTYAYHIDISPFIFILSGTAVILFALAAIGTQAKKAATTNPVDTIRYE